MGDLVSGGELQSPRHRRHHPLVPGGGDAGAEGDSFRENELGHPVIRA